MITQKYLNDHLCGEGMFVPLSGFLIVGYQVIEQIWEQNPNKSGWDNIKETRVISLKVNYYDAMSVVEKKGNQPGRSYDISPIQVEIPSKEAQKKLLFDISSIVDLT